MAEKPAAFAFWQERERQTQQEELSSKKASPQSRRTSNKGVQFRLPPDQVDYFKPNHSQASSKSLPGRNMMLSGSITTEQVDPSELYKPFRHVQKNRPHSVMVLSKRFENSNTVQPPKVSPKPDRKEFQSTANAVDPSSETTGKDDIEEIDNTPTIKSAPPTLDGRKSSWSWRKKPPAASFISYLDGPIDMPDKVDDVHTDQNDFDQQEKSSPIIRSSPVVTKVPRIRHFSAHNSRRETTRVLFRDNSQMEDSLLEEVIEFWKMVQRITVETEKGCTYLTSPAISRFSPHPGTVRERVARGSGGRQERTPARQGSCYSRSSTLPTHVSLAVETGSVVKGETAFVIQCRATRTVSEAIQEVLAMTEHTNHSAKLDHCQYLLKVCGKDEYLESNRCLMDYEYMHLCTKLNVPVSLVLVERSLVKQVMSRTTTVDPEMPSVFASHALSSHDLTVLVDSYLSKDEEFRQFLAKSPVNYPRICHQTVACVRLICERIGFVEPVGVAEAIFDLQRACKSAGGTDDPSNSTAQELPDKDVRRVVSRSASVNPSRTSSLWQKTADDVVGSLDLLKKAVESTVVMYCQMHHCPYEPVWVSKGEESHENDGDLDSDMKWRVKVCGLHRLPTTEASNYQTFQVQVCVYYGGQAICKRTYSPPAKITRNFFHMVTWNKWMNTYLTLFQIPREARVCFTLYGLNPPTSAKEYQHIKKPIAWVARQLFTSKGKLVSGPQLLEMWREDTPADPTDTPHPNMADRKCLLLEVHFEKYRYQYGEQSNRTSRASRPVRPPPLPMVAKNMQDISSKDRFERMSDEDLRLVWTHRSSTPSLLSPYARGLPILIQAVPTGQSKDLNILHNLLALWPVHDPTHGLELLDSQYPDIKVRQTATNMISQLSEDDFVDLLPQIVQSLKQDCHMTSAMHELLLKQAIASPRTAHYLYWNLVLLTSDSRFGWRYELLLSALLAACGEELAMELSQQSDLVKGLSDVASIVKNTRDVHRQTALIHAMESFSASLPPVFRLPLNPALQCCDTNIEHCSFFNSKTVPLKLSFKNADPYGNDIQVIFKVGDDLRQDMLALQLIKLMDKIWLRAGLDLRVISYQVLATGEEQGFVELVTESATLRQIQTEHGLTGSFKDKPLWEWLMRYNSSDSAWKRATENFTHSCAGYCVATYVLGICDRHNDNIMVKRSGHMFHIDFGKILGNAQMFGSIKRDRTPFVLTPDMAYVINAGDKPSVRFQKFTDLCCAAYNELRKHSHLFLSLLSLLLSSNLPELSSMDDIRYVRDALLPSATEEEATFLFTKHIEASLGSVATQINFFIHNLAQYKFSSPSSTQGLLSFSPSSYSIATDGKISSAVVVAYHLKYYPEKYIVYQIQVIRCDRSKQDSILFRRYSEFNELHNKLLESFPEDDLPHLPGKTYLPGRSCAQETSERRRDSLNKYLATLLDTDTRISESDVVYTFLHCLLRDEQDLRKMREEEQAAADSVAGQVKLDLRYSEQDGKLSIMVQHVRELVPREGSDSTDPYVKLYLLPDPHKQTKLKTKIARKTLNPTYNEMFHYNLSREEMSSKYLQLTVWDASSLLSKECLGVVKIKLVDYYSELIRGLITWFELQSASLVNRS